MIIGYEASNVLRTKGPMGDYARELVMQIAEAHVRDYRAMLFCPRVRSQWRGYYLSCTNVSTFVASGTIAPELFMRYRIGAWLKSEKVQLLHGLNSELPYHIAREVKTVVSYYGLKQHQTHSLPDALASKVRMRYAFSAADVVVAISPAARQELVDMGVPGSKIVVIGGSSNPMEVTPEVVQQHFELYSRLIGSTSNNDTI